MKEDRLKGVNISSELVLLNLLSLEDCFASVPPFLEALKKNKINAPFLSTSGLEKGRGAVSCCFAKKDVAQVRQLIQKNDRLKNHEQITPGVGLISVFPHRSSLTILGLSLSALQQANLSVLAMASSISSLVFVLEYHQLATAVDSLKACCFSTGGVR